MNIIAIGTVAIIPKYHILNSSASKDSVFSIVSYFPRTINNTPMNAITTLTKCSMPTTSFLKQSAPAKTVKIGPIFRKTVTSEIGITPNMKEQTPSSYKINVIAHRKYGIGNGFRLSR